MIHLIYVSSATHDLSDLELDFLLQQSRDRNLRQHITGMLLYVNGSFMQVLEGDESDVDEIYAAIVEDDRNAGNIVLTHEPILTRDFPNWSMGFKRLDANCAPLLPGYSHFLSKRYTAEELSQLGVVTKLLYQFKETNV